MLRYIAQQRVEKLWTGKPTAAAAAAVVAPTVSKSSSPSSPVTPEDFDILLLRKEFVVLDTVKFNEIKLHDLDDLNSDDRKDTLNQVKADLADPKQKEQAAKHFVNLIESKSDYPGAQLFFTLKRYIAKPEPIEVGKVAEEVEVKAILDDIDKVGATDDDKTDSYGRVLTELGGDKGVGPGQNATIWVEKFAGNYSETQLRWESLLSNSLASSASKEEKLDFHYRRLIGTLLKLFTPSII